MSDFVSLLMFCFIVAPDIALLCTNDILYKTSNKLLNICSIWKLHKVEPR